MVTGVTVPKMTANVISNNSNSSAPVLASTATPPPSISAMVANVVTSNATTSTSNNNNNNKNNNRDIGPMPAKSDRRSNKPIMEKRRRARINNCLNELKTLILDATKKDPARHSKLEKADILEKTVKHLQELQRQQAVMQQVTDPKVLNKFKAGFADCANEVSRFPGLDPVAKRRLLQHLSNCINGMKAELHNHQRQTPVQSQHQIHAQMLPSPPSSPEQDHHHHNNSNTNNNHNHHHPHIQQLSQGQQRHAHQQQQQPSPQQATLIAAANSPFTIQQTVNGHFLTNGLPVIPTKLPNGSIALVLPQNLSQQYQQQQQQLLAKQQTPQINAVAMMRQQQIIQQQQQQKNQHHHHQHPAVLVTAMTPLRTASTGSASSSSHSSGYERSTLSPPTGSTLHPYAPPSPANSYEAMDFKPSVIQHAAASSHPYANASQHEQDYEQLQQQLQAQNQQPLSLVIKKNIIKEEDQPWRPW